MTSLDSFIKLLIDFFSSPVDVVIFKLFITFGWAIFVWLLLFVAIYFYVEYRQGKYMKDWKWVLLAIDIPANNEQSPKAVEQLFAHLAGALNKPDIAEKYRGGFVQRWFSFEIISIDGYIQFLVRTEESLRDLVEAAMYAQYPEADITEVEDYTINTPKSFPDEEYDIWAADFGLAENNAYPLRTYRDFEHSVARTETTALRDPMSAFLESFSRIGQGEQMWFQILISPISNNWKEKAIKKIKEMIGENSSSKSIGDMMTDAPLKLLQGIGDQFFTTESTPTRPEPLNKLSMMTPGQVKLVEAMENKISKIGFRTKMRGVYLARKEVFRPNRGVSALMGAINQFNVPSANSLVPKSGVGASYFFTKNRSNTKKINLLNSYKKRKISNGSDPFVLNIEELATIWHFPISTVKTPLLQKSEGKKSEPPISLPMERVFGETVLEEKIPENKNSFKTDAGDFGYGSEENFG
ncbi:MAG: hypothetical protein L3J07_00950 [Candidatus Magasanikbacteria bacterium]|nr:hypothetical protein [Candidatus Magasanikbacteria bacterium]